MYVAYSMGLIEHVPHVCCSQALEQNYITFKALSMGAGSSQQQQPSEANIAALGSSEAAGMDISEGEDDDDQDERGLGELSEE